ncbi:MAG: hypothetical protein HN704_14235 [Bacteroidetes bacterium]|jgi:hypothetical protein|nr:hypothetical protein [Bacteroidota bacterium]MBT6685351.1 hypothetical protein [Bacteroidota bacterium]MBT7145069.1 hypothetical protein [Bacteroidota bacterium]MBT7492754.1 hypothetical protein [Bacteroidota bacterium]
MKQIHYIILIILCLSIQKLNAQNNQGQLSGNFQLDAQTYTEDIDIGAAAAPEKLLSNSYANFNFIKGNFSAGLRFEGYLNTLQGFDQNINAVGIPYKYLTYKAGDLEVTVGNYYEQFGNGLIFRSYEEKAIDIDNAMEGIRLKYNPHKGVYIKGFVGKQRDHFEVDESGFSKLINSGLVRGIDGELFVNEIFNSLSENKTQIILGGSFVSKFQEGDSYTQSINDTTIRIYKLPENVGAYAGRISLLRAGFNLSGEYAYKIADPSGENHNIYRHGEAFLINATYSTKGLGIFLTAKRVDNMAFRSDRSAQLNSLNMNNLPTITKNHTYSLAAMYPYATQPNGEIGFQGEIIYKLKKKSTLGGKYGTNISVNFSQANSIEKTQIDENTAIDQEWTDGYNSDFFAIGNEKYFQDFNIEINKKISKKWKALFTYQNLLYNYNIIRGTSGHEDVKANIFIADITFKPKKKHAIRVEFQSLTTKQDKGDWAMGLIEYSISPHWFFTVIDQYNYGNPEEDKQFHYYSASIAFNRNANRFQIGYGKQREGIMCVGGVCRAVPASNGLTLSITSSF